MDIATLALITRYFERRRQALLGVKKGNPQIGKGKVNGPGGRMEPFDKTIEDCLYREVEEEVGILLDPRFVRKCAIITFWAKEIPFQEVHVYRATAWKGEPHETESMVPAWYDTAKLPLDQMHDSDCKWIPQLIWGQSFRTNVYYREPGRGYLRMGPLFQLTDHG